MVLPFGWWFYLAKWWIKSFIRKRVKKFSDSRAVIKTREIKRQCQVDWVNWHIYCPKLYVFSFPLVHTKDERDMASTGHISESLAPFCYVSESSQGHISEKLKIVLRISNIQQTYTWTWFAILFNFLLDLLKHICQLFWT